MAASIGRAIWLIICDAVRESSVLVSKREVETSSRVVAQQARERTGRDNSKSSTKAVPVMNHSSSAASSVGVGRIQLRKFRLLNGSHMIAIPTLLWVFANWHYHQENPYTQTFVWLHSGAQQQAQVTLESSNHGQIAVLSYKASARLIWTSSVDVSSRDGAGRVESPRPSASAFPARNGTRLIHLSAPIPNWAQSVFWLTTEHKAEPLVFRYRDDFANVFKLGRRNGAVTRLVVYDRWIGGPPSVRTTRGKRVDRWEKVTTYELTTAGLRIAHERYRLVPATGGGVHEQLFVWLSRAR